MSDFMILLLLILAFGSGAYALYTAIKLKIKGCLFANKFLYPANCQPADCTDEVGFMSYMIPRLFILGIVCIVFGAVLVFNEYVGFGFPAWFSAYVLPFLGVIPFVWFIIVQTRTSTLFW